MTMRRRNYVTMRQLMAMALVLMTALLWTVSASAQTPTTEEVYRIADKLNCPLCQGLSLSDCPLVVCDQMRDLIREKLAKGETDEQIIQYFVDQYGEQVLSAPPARGFNLLVWVLPFVGLLFGVSLVIFAVRGWLRGQGPAGPTTVHKPAEQPPSEYMERLEKELEEFG